MFKHFMSMVVIFLATAASAQEVTTQKGIAVGVTVEGITSFKGIRYATAERWQAPEPASGWEGRRSFDAFGAACPQIKVEVLTEDCLFLNVWKPEAAQKGDNLPVAVWIHGGGFIKGSGNFAPENFAQDGVVVVSFNYRLGKLGFHNDLEWSKNEPRNFGMLDMIEALKWVQANIAAFGGNPDHVTILGHSAGGMGVQLMMVSPDARGLFHAAISQAGYGSWPFPGIMDEGSHLESAMTLEKIVGLTPFFVLPYVGGSDLAGQPTALFVAGKQSPVPYISGGNSYDGRGVLYGAGFNEKSFLALYDNNLDTLKLLYVDDFAVSEAQAAQRIFGDARYVRSALDTVVAMKAINQPGYIYYFDQAFDGMPGSPHGAEYRYLFAKEDSQVKTYWLNFVKTGTPNSDGLPEWPAYSVEDNQWMRFTPDPVVEAGVLSDKMAFLKAAQ